jgi:ABC-type phosphate/phosphonate transport system substrate-binding protein
MFGHKAILAGAVALSAGLLGTLSSDADGQNRQRTEPVQIGMVRSLFKDVPPGTVQAMMGPFSALMHAQTGIRGEIVQVADADLLGLQLTTNKAQLGVFHGLDFAWARQKYATLQPLVIAINQHRHLRAYVVVKEDCKASCLAQLGAQTLALPRQTREHCLLFLHCRCRECKKEPQDFFSRISNPVSVEDALDDVVEGQIQATVVDSVALECYKVRKPGRFARLKVIQSSEIFPAAVVAYQPGQLSAATLKKFRDGMMTANQTVLGRQLMTLWKLSAFEPVPTDYEETLINIVKAYPSTTRRD